MHCEGSQSANECGIDLSLESIEPRNKAEIWFERGTSGAYRDNDPAPNDDPISVIMESMSVAVKCRLLFFHVELAIYLPVVS